MAAELGQQRVGVQGDHVAERPREAALDSAEAGDLPATAQDVVQLLKLAAFAFPAHPHAFGRVVSTAAVEEEEPIPVALVEFADAGLGGQEESFVVVAVLGGAVLPVGDRGEVHLAVIVGVEV
ncbi:MAG: hypothetical protein IPL43_10615 [Micropruina sp.]|nr:hypothetical protein [Micropruina sp.]